MFLLRKDPKRYESPNGCEPLTLDEVTYILRVPPSVNVTFTQQRPKIKNIFDVLSYVIFSTYVVIQSLLINFNRNVCLKCGLINKIILC